MHDVCVSVKDHLTQFCQFIYKPNTKEKGMNIFDEGGGGGKSFSIILYARYMQKPKKRSMTLNILFYYPFPEMGKKR